MKFNTTFEPSHQEKEVITNGLWSHNSRFHPVEIKQFTIEIRDDNDVVKGGLIAQTWWDMLEVQYLWIDELYRGKGYGKEMMLMAEANAKQKGCNKAYVDTFDFQAKGFYEKLGYKEWGSLDGFAGKFKRIYLQKTLN
ncbi:GNAT family N-acetyltransferase [Pantoea agglomerans]|uniref:GNAT family N-acetyltransferase n=1 Tax=Enterobacter agglomerans TaxID=549 RepID=UPI0016546756|nr:GNAT family N-acetyltransferase [Pantoea agglomerans]